MTKSKPPIISQSEVKILKKEALGITPVPSNSVYFRRYPYKVVFNLKFDTANSYQDQLGFRLDLSSFTEDILTYPTRQHMFIQRPCLFINDYDDLLLTLSVYKDYIHQVSGPISAEHLDLLFSKSYKCQSKDSLWYNTYDCKLNTWLPIRWSNAAYGSTNSFENSKAEMRSLINYIKDNIDIHVPKYWTNRFSTTLYCGFSELVEILPFLKLSYPNHKLIITKAILNS